MRDTMHVDDGLGVREARVGWAVVGVLAWCMSAASVRAESDDQETGPAWFVAEYRRAVQVFREAYGDIRIEGARTTARTRTNVSPRSEKKSSNSTNVTDFVYASTDGKERISTRPRRTVSENTEQTKPADGVATNGSNEIVKVHAGRDYFWVARTRPEASYQLGSLGAASPDSTFQFERRELVDAPFCPAGMSAFPDCVWSKEFKVREVTRLSGPEGPLVKVTFEYLPTKKDRNKMRGWIAVDPSMNWAIKRYEIDEHAPMEKSGIFHIVGRVRYKNQRASVVPVEISYTRAISNKEFTLEASRSYQISRFEFAATPSEEFTLAAFGLGDFENPSARKINRVPYYAGAIALTAFLAAILLRQIARAARRGRGGASGGETPV